MFFVEFIETIPLQDFELWVALFKVYKATRPNEVYKDFGLDAAYFLTCLEMTYDYTQPWQRRETIGDLFYYREFLGKMVHEIEIELEGRFCRDDFPSIIVNFIRLECRLHIRWCIFFSLKSSFVNLYFNTILDGCLLPTARFWLDEFDQVW